MLQTPIMGVPVTHASSEDPEANLRFAAATKHAARRARPRRSVTLLGLAVVVCGSVPFYRMAEFDAPRPSGQGVSLGAGFSGLATPTAAVLYWLIAVPLLYGLLATYIVISGNRSGVRSSATKVVLWGSISFVVVATVSVVGPHLIPGPLASRGLLPVLTISLGVMVWGLLDRDGWIVGIGALATAVGLLGNLYNLENVLVAQGIAFDETWRLLPNIGAAGLTLILGAVAVAWRDRR